MEKETGGYAQPLYARPIAIAIANGDLTKMKALAVEAETYIKEHGDISAALEALKIEIAKLEK